MADNVAITAGSGTTVATDQIPGTLEHIQIVKLADGTADSAARIPGDATAGLKVNLGADNDVTVTSGTITAVTSVTNVVHVDDNSGSLTVDDGGGSLTVDGTVAVSGAVDTELTTADLDTGAGTDTRAVVGLVGAKSGGGVLIPGDATKGLAVDLTATGANAIALNVDGSAVTQPVSAASLPLPTGASTAAKQPALGTAGTASADVITVQGIAAMTALKVDGSAVTQPVSGTVTVQDGGGAISIDDNGSTISIDDGAGSLTVDGTVTAAGAAADDAAISGNPVPIGAKAASGPRTSVTAGDVVYPMANLQGALIVHHNLRENLVQQHTTITSSTSETTIVTADATYAQDLYGLIVTNTSATASKVTIKDSTAGTTRMVLMVPASETRGFMLPSDSGHKQSAANNNWTATCGTSVADIDICAFVVKRV